jgi:hypothetical protein
MADPETEIQNLESDYPIALLPVRIETRFAGDFLHVRIYPDEIFANLHDPDLGEDEHAAGVAYWTEAWQPADERTAWARLVARYPATRAAWIVRVLEPANLSARPAGSPSFPTVGTRAASLARAVAELLPTAWTVIAYRGGAEVARVTSNDIQRPLALSFRPDVDESDPALVSYEQLRIEEDLAWTIDFQRALAAGMAVSVPLNGESLRLGFDRVLVVGVMTGVEPSKAANQLAALLDAHHYTRGLALVRQGTPTNNLGTEPAGYPAPDDPEYSFAVERDAPLAEVGSDGARIALALGLPTAVFDHVAGANQHEEEAAEAMARALWPCTLGYFLEQLASPHVSRAHVADIREHFGDFVRGRGPFAAFRIGRVPYGLLPVTSLARWKPATSHTADVKLPPLLDVWRQRVLALADAAAHIGKTGDPDADLLGVLALDASAREVRLREVIGPAHLSNLLALLGLPAAAEQAARTTFVNGLLADLGLGGLRPRFSNLTFGSSALRIGRPLAAEPPLSETERLADNYIEWIRFASIEDLRSAGSPGSPSFKHPLLFHLLRQAALLEYARVALDVSIAHRRAVELDRVEVELVGIVPGTEGRATHWTRFAQPLEGVTGDPLGKWLLEPSSTDVTRQPVRDLWASLDVLAPLPTAELDRLTAETLDTCAYRLDAWLTSMATRMLLSKRAAIPQGVHVGAYAWVDNLRPRTSPRPGTAGGFVHAPSATHAAAAAILRSGYLTRTGPERDQVAIDLSSRRVRSALELVDGVCQGQRLGALLGYRFERSVHAAHLDKYIAPLRGRFPLGADPGSPPSETSERIPARDVVDGLALRTALAGATTVTTIPWANFPPVATGDRSALGACLLQLDGDVDATADLMLAESIYQAVQGNTDRASATLAALAGGGTLPEPQIAAVPARATSFTQRVAVLLGDPGALAAGWNAAAPRARANPRLDAWLAARLGVPANVTCRISYPDPAQPEQTLEATVSLADLDVCALDAVALARQVPPEGGGELDARIRWHAAHTLGIATPIAIAHDRGSASPLEQVTFLELLEVARLFGEMLAGARPLLPVDLTADATGTQTPDAAELLARGGTAHLALQAARDELATAATAAQDGSAAAITALRVALWNVAAFGLRAAVPASALGNDAETSAALLTQTSDALAEANRRLAAMADAPSDGLAQLHAAFGPELLALPTFVAANHADVLAAIAGGPSIVGDAFASRRWFEGAARVRTPLARVRLAALACEAIAGGALDFAATQLPLGTRWIGRSFDPDVPAQQPRPGTLSLVLHTAFDLTSSWAGLVFDDWTEAIPARTQLTSLAVNYDAPGAEAPQCVLLAVPPTPERFWDLGTLVDIVAEAADMGKLRAVDSDLLTDYGMAVPTTHIAANVADDTISSDLARHLVKEVRIMSSE